MPAHSRPVVGRLAGLSQGAVSLVRCFGPTIATNLPLSECGAPSFPTHACTPATARFDVRHALLPSGCVTSDTSHGVGTIEYAVVMSGAGEVPHDR